MRARAYALVCMRVRARVCGLEKTIYAQGLFFGFCAVCPFDISQIIRKRNS